MNHRPHRALTTSSTRLCQSCGAPVSEDFPCTICSLESVLKALVEKPSANHPERFKPFDLPSSFGHYQVEREIAAGGMGMVYEAQDTRLRRRVALKMLRHVFFASEKERLRFQTEAELASQLEHPNIVPIHEVGKIEGQPFFTMQLIRGGNLAERLATGAIPPSETAALMIKITGAVHHAHQHGVLHCDLKPANVLLDEAGEPWLTDFGLAKLLNTDAALTLTQTIAGTPHYMAPEQIQGRKKEISTATDIWALGVMLYQMLTGSLPFHGESHSEILRQVTDKEPPAPSTIYRRIDRDLETLCLRCLEKDPTRRLSSAGELAMELKRWQRGEPLHARRITSRERFGKWMRRHPVRAVLLGTAAVAILSAGTAITWQWRRAEASANMERRTAYSATLGQALAAREHHDLGLARRLLNGIDPELRGFDWRLLNGLCRGDDLQAYRLGAGPGAEPQCLTLLPGGKQIALISADGHLHLRDLQGDEAAPPRALPPLREAGHRYYGLTFSPNGQRLAYASGDALQVLDANTLTVLYEETSRLPQFGWLDDDRFLYGFNGSVAPPPFPEPGAWILNFRGVHASNDDIERTAFPEMCAPLAVSPDRRLFVLHRVDRKVVSWPRTLHIYPVGGDFAEIPEPVYTMPGREYPGEFAFSRTGKFLAFSAGRTLKLSARVLEVASGGVLFDSKFRFPIHGLAIDPQEHRLGLVGSDSVVRQYDFTRGSPKGAYADTYDDEGSPDRLQAVGGRGAHAPPRDLITRSAQDGRARFYLGHENRVFDLVFEATGALVTVGGDGTIRRWPEGIPRPAVRLANGDATYPFSNGDATYPFRHPSASVDGRLLLLRAGWETRVYDVALSRAGPRDVSRPVAASDAPLAVLGDGRLVTRQGDSNAVLVWEEAADGQLRLSGTGPEWKTSVFVGDGQTRRGVLSRDESHLAAVMDGWLLSIDLEKGSVTGSGDLGQRVSEFANHDLSPDGEWIASSDFGARVTIHRFAEPGIVVATLGGDVRDYDTAVAFGRDGDRLYTGNEDGRIRVWDTATWKELPDLGWSAHRSAVTAIAVSHDRTLIASSGDDTLKLFPIEPEPGEPHRRERLSFHLDQPANWIQFARDKNGRDRALLHSVPGGTLDVWETDWEETQPESAPADSRSLPIPLRRHAAILLPDGKVLVAGGVSLSVVSECHLYDRISGSWSATGPLRRPREGMELSTMLLPSGNVLAAGGTGRGNVLLDSCELYEPESGTWLTTGSMADPHSGGARILLRNGKVLAAGGSDAEGGLVTRCELYDPESGVWYPTGALATPRNHSNWVLLASGKVLAVGGDDGRGDFPECELYDPDTETWTPTGSPVAPRRLPNQVVALPSGQALIIGGAMRGEYIASCELYDPLSGTWKLTGSLPKQRQHHTATRLPNGKVLITGGSVGDKLEPDYLFTNTALLYDPDTGSWSAAPDLLHPRLTHTATLLENGKVLLVGGVDGTGCLTNSVEVYDATP